MQIGELSGQISSLHTRFAEQVQAINEIRAGVAEQISSHEERENKRFESIEVRLAKIERLVWTSIGSVASLGGVIAVVQKVFITS